MAVDGSITKTLVEYAFPYVPFPPQILIGLSVENEDPVSETPPFEGLRPANFWILLHMF